MLVLTADPVCLLIAGALLTETLGKRGDHWRRVHGALEKLIRDHVDAMNHGRGSRMIEDRAMCSILVRVDGDGVVHYRGIYNGYNASDDESDWDDYPSGPDYAYFDVDMFGGVKHAIGDGNSWEASSKLDKKEGWAAV